MLTTQTKTGSDYESFSDALIKQALRMIVRDDNMYDVILLRAKNRRISLRQALWRVISAAYELGEL